MITQLLMQIPLLCGIPAAAPIDQAGLMIIAPAKFQEALQPYLEHKKAIRPTEIVVMEQWLQRSAGDSDDAEWIKKRLFDRWKQGAIGHVLLVGDADAFPVRYMVLDRVTAPAFDYAFYPSDLYYADLAEADGTFETWNASRDDFHRGYFGEVRGEKNKSDPINFDQIDYHPEVAVGRWPVSTVQEVQTLVAKSIAYEKSIIDETRHDANNAALIACGGWIENRPLMDGVAAHFPRTSTIEKRYFADTTRNDRTAPPDETQVLDLMNSGCGLILHSGHGNDDRWEGSISTASIAKLTNGDRLPVMMSAGCSTARFATLPPYEAYVDAQGVSHAGTNSGEVFTAPPPPPACHQSGPHNPSGLGEQLLRAGPNGAVAYIGCNTGSQPCGMTLMEGFVRGIEAAESENPTIGGCWIHAVNHYHMIQNLDTIKSTEDWYPASIFFQGMKFMLFGDPSLPIR